MRKACGLIFYARRAEGRSMNELKESIHKLKDGQILKVYFDRIGKEEADGRDERAGVHTRGAEAGHLDEPGGDSTKRG